MRANMIQGKKRFRRCQQKLTDISTKFLEFSATVRMIAQKEEERIRRQLNQEMRTSVDTTILEMRLEKLQPLNNKKTN